MKALIFAAAKLELVKITLKGGKKGSKYAEIRAEIKQNRMVQEGRCHKDETRHAVTILRQD